MCEILVLVKCCKRCLAFSVINNLRHLRHQRWVLLESETRTRVATRIAILRLATCLRRACIDLRLDECRMGLAWLRESRASIYRTSCSAAQNKMQSKTVDFAPAHEIRSAYIHRFQRYDWDGTRFKWVTWPDYAPLKVILSSMGYGHAMYQIWRLSLQPLWRYERRYEMWKKGWFGIVRITRSHWKYHHSILRI